MEAIWRCYNGSEDKAAPDMNTPVWLLHREEISECYSGQETKAAPGIRRFAHALLVEVT